LKSYSYNKHSQILKIIFTYDYMCCI
jgi:hypothetical protein